MARGAYGPRSHRRGPHKEASPASLGRIRGVDDLSGLYCRAALDGTRGITGGAGRARALRAVCKDGRITVCVHPAYERALSEAAAAIAKPLSGLPGAPTRAEQREPDLRTNVEPTRRLPDVLLVFDLNRGVFDRWNTESGVSLEEFVQPDLARALVAEEPIRVEALFDPETGADPCARPGELPGEAQNVVAGWLVWQAGKYDSARSFLTESGSFLICERSESALERFVALGESERQAWLRENYADLRAGRLKAEDLP